MAPHPENLEQEANLFAATLLMPADDFWSQMQGQSPTLATLSRLADDRYQTSLTATCTRLICSRQENVLDLCFRAGQTVV